MNTPATPRVLNELLEGLCDLPSTELVVTGLSLDSRYVQPGDLFLACPGVTEDGRRYIDHALAHGAAAVLYEPEGFPPPHKASIDVIPVAGLRYVIGLIAQRFYRHPSQSLCVIGVTGTNGKTTCTHLLTQAFEALRVRCGLIGTLGTGFLDEIRQTRTTTPDAVALQRELRRLADAGASHVCMEVSSHALDQGRVVGVDFDAAVFTNLTHEHLDYHGCMARYGKAKADLFTFERLSLAILNRDDPFSAVIESRTAAKTWTYGLHSGTVTAPSISVADSGIVVVMKTPSGMLTVRSSLIGRINALNLLAVATVLLAFGREQVRIGQALEQLQPVPGRMELFQAPNDSPRVIVDYAHTPDALEQALKSVREHCQGQVWCVFGCGGDRDRGKRPKMGAIAEELADQVVLTDDNPRFEAPESIMNDIVSGMHNVATIIHDRVRAIEWAIENATCDDWILVAGKGHETEQVRRQDRLPLSDRDVVSELLGIAA